MATKKRIIICSDGTWNNPEQKNVTNVVRTARAILPVDRRGMPQLVFYDWGVGSEGVGNKVAGGVLGKGIDKNIQDAYRLSQCHSSLKFGSAPVVDYADFFSFFSSALSAPRSNGSCA